jgi:hypothetical protein
MAWSSRLGRGVRLISSARIRSQHDLHEAEHPRAARPVFFEDLGAGDVARHEVRRELDAGEPEAQGLGHRGDDERLGQTGHAFQQRVASREDRGQDAVDDLLLTHDLMAHLLEQPLAGLRQVRELLDVVLGCLSRIQRHRRPLARSRLRTPEPRAGCGAGPES